MPLLKVLFCRRSALRKALLALFLFSYFTILLLCFASLKFRDNIESVQKLLGSEVPPLVTDRLRRHQKLLRSRHTDVVKVGQTISNSTLKHLKPKAQVNNLTKRIHGIRLRINSTRAINQKRAEQILWYQRKKLVYEKLSHGSSHFIAQDVVPLIQPLIDIEIGPESSGDFTAIARDTFVFSAYLDDRKRSEGEVFIRLIAIMSKKMASLFIYSHLNTTSRKGFESAERCERYEMCENHEKRFGGFIFSCRVPEANVSLKLTEAIISLSKYGPKVCIPIMNVQPPEDKRSFLDSRLISSPFDNISRTNVKGIWPQRINMSSPNINLSSGNSTLLETSKLHQPTTLSDKSITFAICVSPLFGNVSPSRVVEFLELSKLLGADHFFFYTFNVTEDIRAVLQFYADKGEVTVLPWKLPSVVAPQEIWYHGQLVANNDCLYRSMSWFDLVAFNDLDEFIVPHSQNARSWRQIMPSLLTNRRCGLSLQSAFYDPGFRDFFSTGEKLVTPSMTARSSQFSKIRTKVMLCPWRVFEVGIHHISKQNREEWKTFNVPPTLAYLHHYRRCIPNYGMMCNRWIQDATIQENYGPELTKRFEEVVKKIPVDFSRVEHSSLLARSDANVSFDDKSKKLSFR